MGTVGINLLLGVFSQPLHRPHVAVELPERGSRVRVLHRHNDCCSQGESPVIGHKCRVCCQHIVGEECGSDVLALFGVRRRMVVVYRRRWSDKSFDPERHD